MCCVFGGGEGLVAAGVGGGGGDCLGVGGIGGLLATALLMMRGKGEGWRELSCGKGSFES